MTRTAVRRDAVASADGRYRYRLTRTWDADRPTIAFVMLNPSTADASADDPTIRRCLGYATEWGYGSLLVGNLFAARATDPDRLAGLADPVGPENDEHLLAIHEAARRTVVAWGARGTLRDRWRAVLDMLAGELVALDTTKGGQPVHPLYQPADALPVPFESPEAVAEREESDTPADCNRTADGDRRE